MKNVRWSLVAFGLAVLVALPLFGCGSNGRISPAPPKEVKLPDLKTPDPIPGDGVAALIKVLEKYGAMTTYQSTVSWTFDAVGQGEQKASSERLLFFERPNKHRVVAITGSMKFVSVSDGTKVLEYAGASGKLTKAPLAIWRADAENIRDPQIAGSFLLKLFQGPEGLHDLVQPGESVSLVPTAKDGQLILRFKAQGRYGTTELTIDKATSLVQKVTSMFEPLVEETSKLPASDQLKSVLVTETFANTKTDAPIGKEVFSTTTPAGVKVKDETVAKDDDLNLLSEGIKAPEFELASLDGKRIKLSDLQGQVVLLDFWATWCVPCRESLPNTLAIAKKYGGKGLAVWSIPEMESDAGAINVFLQEQGLQGLPVVLDPQQKAHEAFRIQVIPTYVVINRQGVVQRVFQGSPDVRELLSSLRDAGLPI